MFTVLVIAVTGKIPWKIKDRDRSGLAGVIIPR